MGTDESQEGFAVFNRMSLKKVDRVPGRFLGEECSRQGNSTCKGPSWKNIPGAAGRPVLLEQREKEGEPEEMN